LFKGVFGASDEALGLLESGSNFEKRVMAIYEHCKTAGEFKREFDSLEKDIAAKRNKKNNELKHILSSFSSDEKKKRLACTARHIETYVDNYEKWSKIAETSVPLHGTVLQVQGFNKVPGISDTSHGYICVGVLTKKTNEFIEPILIAFRGNGEYLDIETQEIIQLFKEVPATGFVPYSPENQEMQRIGDCCEKIGPIMAKAWVEQNRPAIIQNDRRIKNWVDNQRGQYKTESDELNRLITNLQYQKNISRHFQEKIDIQKKIDKHQKELNKRDEKFHTKMLEIQEHAEKQKKEFNSQFEIDPIALINLVVKF
jgi:hypothetical protein